MNKIPIWSSELIISEDGCITKKRLCIYALPFSKQLVLEKLSI